MSLSMLVLKVAILLAWSCSSMATSNWYLNKLFLTSPLQYLVPSIWDIPPGLDVDMLGDVHDGEALYCTFLPLRCKNSMYADFASCRSLYDLCSAFANLWTCLLASTIVIYARSMTNEKNIVSATLKGKRTIGLYVKSAWAI